MGKPFVGITTLMLTKNAVDRKVTDVAIDVMKYFTSAAVQKKISLVNKTIPAATAALKDADVQKLAVVTGFGASANLGIPTATYPYSFAYWDPVGKAVALIWTGAQQPKAAMDAAQKAAEDAVKKIK
jgi:arabinogalactan oligomer / maltooligosaccharide transport system substrate-binding protein